MGQATRGQAGHEISDGAASKTSRLTSHLNVLLDAAECGQGGFYEIVIDLGPREGDRLHRAFEALWHYPDLANGEATPGSYRQRGHARLPDGALVPALSFTETMRDARGDVDYLIFALPMPALEKACRLVSDTTPASGLDPLWRAELEGWLADLGRHIDDAVSFAAAYIGFLPFPIGDAEMAEQLFAAGIPAERCVAYLYRRNDRLEFFPTTLWS